MAKERTSVRMQAQIRILSGQGHSIRSIARILRLSRRTVRKFLEPASEPVIEGGGWRMETVDWEYVRQDVYITDPATGNKVLTQFFLGVLPFNSYFFGEFVADQKLATFIGVQSRMFAYFGRGDPLRGGGQSEKRREPSGPVRSRRHYFCQLHRKFFWPIRFAHSQCANRPLLD
jgi:transposase